LTAHVRPRRREWRWSLGRSFFTDSNRAIVGQTSGRAVCTIASSKFGLNRLPSEPRSPAEVCANWRSLQRRAARVSPDLTAPFPETPATDTETIALATPMPPLAAAQSRRWLPRSLPGSDYVPTIANSGVIARRLRRSRRLLRRPANGEYCTKTNGISRHTKCRWPHGCRTIKMLRPKQQLRPTDKVPYSSIRQVLWTTHANTYLPINPNSSNGSPIDPKPRASLCIRLAVVAETATGDRVEVEVQLSLIQRNERRSVPVLGEHRGHIQSVHRGGRFPRTTRRIMTLTPSRVPVLRAASSSP
jgi:hypothetical protein